MPGRRPGDESILLFPHLIEPGFQVLVHGVLLWTAMIKRTETSVRLPASMPSKQACRMGGQNNCSSSRRRIVRLLACGGVAAWASPGLTEAQTAPPGGETPRYGGGLPPDRCGDPPPF